MPESREIPKGFDAFIEAYDEFSAAHEFVGIRNELAWRCLDRMERWLSYAKDYGVISEEEKEALSRFSRECVTWLLTAPREEIETAVFNPCTNAFSEWRMKILEVAKRLQS